MTISPKRRKLTVRCLLALLAVLLLLSGTVALAEGISWCFLMVMMGIRVAYKRQEVGISAKQ